MSLKRSLSSGRSSFGSGGEAGAKVDRQELYDELKRLAATAEAFTPVDVSLAIGAGEPQVSKALLGLAAEGYLEKAEVGKYRATTVADLSQAEFLKAFARASKVDSTRQRDLSEIGRLKQNNDTMRQRLLAAIAERDHYLAALKKHGIDAGPPPVPVVPVAEIVEARLPSPAAMLASSAPAPGPAGLSVPSPEPAEAPSGPGDDHGHDASASAGPEHG
ncbi:MAG TPA: hypothetical protein VG319_06005 [Polyangia bacterium]|jgi:hypothetical protein|nr:hypothetical protein [Polyangia bacterium]